MTAPPKSRKSRSTELTGGEGFTYEDTIVAYYLTALLDGGNAAGITGQLTRVAVQQAAVGEPLDDLIVDAEVQSEPRRLSLQIKRDVTISAAESNEDFREIIAQCVATRRKSNFRVGVDRYGFIARSSGEEKLNALKRIITKAQSSTTGAEFEARFSVGAEMSQSDSALRDELKGLLQSTDADQEVDFYRHFVAHRLDNFEVGGDRFADMSTRLGHMTVDGPKSGPTLAEILCRRVRAGEGAGKVWSRSSLIADIRNLIGLKASQAFVSDISVLTELAATYLAEIRRDIGGVIITRAGLVEKAISASETSKLTNISGLPGCGKSVVLRGAVETALARGPVLFLKGDRLSATSWRGFATEIGLQNRAPSELLVEIGACGTPTLFIDGIDRIKPVSRAVITDLMHAIESDPTLAHWRVLVSSRDQGLEPFRQWVPASFYQATGIGNVAVGPLDDREAEELASARPHLRRLLFGDKAVKEIARRPFFAAVLAEQFMPHSDGLAPAPQTEIELIEAWWRAGGYNAEAKHVLLRQRALIDLARKGASTLGRAVSAKSLEAGTIEQLSDLQQDQIVQVVTEGSSFSFGHDIFFEWAYFRLLIDEGQSWSSAIIAAGEPPLLARVVALLSQRAFEAGGTWATDLKQISGVPLRPQWRRSWLLGPPESALFFQSVETFDDAVFADKGTLLIKFLVWFQAEKTIPNPLILQNVNTGLDGAALVRAADMLGWPSDSQTWHRVLIWLMTRESELPAAAILQTVELFAVFQNMFGEISNPTSEKLIILSENWLLSLELPSVQVGTDANPANRWHDLTSGQRGHLKAALRQLLLRSARSYPEHARRVVERAIALEDRREALFDSIVSMSGFLASTCPETLAELISVEVFEQLPLQKKLEEEAKEEARYERLAEIRAKPMKDRTEIERRIVGGAMHLHGTRTYDFNEIGIDRHHRSFFPASPRHQPFAALFDQAPDVARRLVRDISNRATIGWRQIFEINSPRYGTPLPIEVSFPWGKQAFWGDGQTYSWFLGELGPQPLEAAMLSLTYWAHKRVDAGDPVDNVIRDAVEGHESWAVLGLAISLALETQHLSAATLALVAAQQLWQVDNARMVSNPGQDFNILGINPKDQMTNDQRRAVEYLQNRRFRRVSLQQLVMPFAVSGTDELKSELKEALAKFPTDLPYMYEEQKDDDQYRVKLEQLATVRAGWGDPANYTIEDIDEEPGLKAVSFEPPNPEPEEFEEQRQASSRAIGDISALGWAEKSIREGKPNAEFLLADMVALACERDSTDLLKGVAEPGLGITQSCVSSVAAVAAMYSESAPEIDWAWSVLDRVKDIANDNSVFRDSPNPHDPRYYLIAVHKELIERGAPRLDSAEQIIRLAGHKNSQIASTAIAILLRLRNKPELVWIASGMASELFVWAAPIVNGEGVRDNRPQEAHVTGVIQRALFALNSGGEVSLVGPPQAWVEAPSRHRHVSGKDEPIMEWQHPDHDFNAQFAAPLVKHFPIEAFSLEPARLNAVLTYLDKLVAWTVERIFPSWQEEQERRRSSTDLFEWIGSLAGLISRTSTVLPAKQLFTRYVEPFSRQQHEDGLKFVGEFTDTLVRRYVFDAPKLSANTIDVLEDCLDVLLQQVDFKPEQYRTGDIRGRNLPDMIRSLLLVSVPSAPAAARFANGQWSELPQLLPLIEKLMGKCGWIPFVMENYLTMCERAKDSLPIADFARHVSVAIEQLEKNPQLWSGTSIPARIAGVVQSLADTNQPMAPGQARALLIVLDQLIDMGDRRAAALQQSEHFRGVQL